MNAIKWKNALYIVLVLAAIVSAITWCLGDEKLTIKFILDCIGNSATIITIIASIFCSKLWKFGIFQGWLVLIPNLNGTWKGTIMSNWINPETNKTQPPIDSTLRVKQSLFKISCVVTTGESTSNSIIADFVIEPEKQIRKLVYTYQNDPFQVYRSKSPIHYGTASLTIIEKNNSLTLTGNYWTDRETTGTLDYHFKHK